MALRVIQALIEDIAAIPSARKAFLLQPANGGACTFKYDALVPQQDNLPGFLQGCAVHHVQ
jgi:hypothetical protein